MRNSSERHSPRFADIIESLLREGHQVRFRAFGWSMHPTIRNGELIRVAPLGPSSIQSGDVVLCRRENATIVHRVVTVRSSSSGSSELILRGDAEDFCDRPIPVDQALGRVEAVEAARHTLYSGFLGRTWSRMLARTIRRAHDARMKARAVFPRRISLT